MPVLAINGHRRLGVAFCRVGYNPAFTRSCTEDGSHMKKVIPADDMAQCDDLAVAMAVIIHLLTRWLAFCYLRHV